LPSLAVLVVAYEAEATVEDVLERIPAEVHGRPVEVLVADDASKDRTAELARGVARRRPGESRRRRCAGDGPE